jgi:hypothetical protein
MNLLNSFSCIVVRPNQSVYFLFIIKFFYIYWRSLVDKIPKIISL